MEIRTTFMVNFEMLALIAEIDEFKGGWYAMSTLPPKRLSSWRNLATRQSIGASVSIEGYELSDQQIESILPLPDVVSFNTRALQKAGGYANAITKAIHIWKNIKITEDHIKKLHRTLLKYEPNTKAHRGEYKTESNHISVSPKVRKRTKKPVFETASPDETSELMRELIAWYQQTKVKKEMHPLIMIGVFIAVFLDISPFQDGNGRLSIILTTILMLRSGYSYVSYSSLEKIIEQNREEFFELLHVLQISMRTENPDWIPWLTCFLKAVHAQMTQLRTKVKMENALKKKGLPPLSHDIMNYVGVHGRVTVAEAVKVTRKNRSTVKAHFKQLVEQDMLVLCGKGRGARYELP